MKKRTFFLLSLFLFIFFGSLFFFFQKNKKSTSERNDILSLESMPANTVEVVVGKRFFWASWIKIEKDNINNVFLYPNFLDKYTAKYISEKQKCKNIVSGAFYSKQDTPLGLLISEGNVIKEKVRSAFLNAIFYALFDGTADISYSQPLGSIRFAVQSGPLLMNNQSYLEFQIKSDKLARRILVATTVEKDLFFISLYDHDSLYLGPYLEEVPSVIKQIENYLEVKFNSVLNLDGGRGSAFYSDYVFLDELTYIGEYFCII